MRWRWPIRWLWHKRWLVHVAQLSAPAVRDRLNRSNVPVTSSQPASVNLPSHLLKSSQEVYEIQKSCSNIGTVGMESCVVLFNPCIHLFACTHPSVSNTFDCNALFVYKHQSTALCSNTFDCDALFVYKHQSPALCSKHVWIVVPCLCTSISLQPCVSNTFGL